MKNKIKEIFEAKETLDQLRKSIEKKSTKASEKERLRDLLNKGSNAIVSLMFDIDTSEKYWEIHVDKKECERKITAMFDWIEKAKPREDLDFFNSWGYGCEQANVTCALLDEIFNNWMISQVLSAEFLISLFQRWVKFTIWDKAKKIGFVKNIIEYGWRQNVDFMQGRDYRQMIRQLDHGF